MWIPRPHAPPTHTCSQSVPRAEPTRKPEGMGAQEKISWFSPWAESGAEGGVGGAKEEVSITGHVARGPHHVSYGSEKMPLVSGILGCA